ncbi:MAG TPA: hypothetical protein VF981_11350 [Gemmatimonadaceae bacterium]
MGKVFLLVAGVALGYSVGFRDAAANRKHIASRVVEQLRSTFHGRSGTDVDSLMSRLEDRK